MTEQPKRKRRSYTLEDRELGLATLVLNAGNAMEAARQLAAAGNPIPWRTLYAWRDEYADRYQALQADLHPKVQEKIAAQAEAIALSIADKEAELVAALDITQLPPKEIAGALRNLTTSKALQVDKIQGPLRGRPVEHRHTYSPDELLTKLARNLGISAIDSTAVDITDPTSRPLTQETAASNAR